MKADKIRDLAAMQLMGMVNTALHNYNLETQLGAKELPLNGEIAVGDVVAYAVTKFSIVCTNGERIKFLKLDREDILTLQEIISKEYDIDIPEK